MINVTGIGTLTTTGQPAGVRGRDQQGARPATVVGDEVAFSGASQQAAHAALLIEKSAAESEVRAERVEAAKENLRQNSHKVQEVVYQVAAVLTKYL